MHSKPQPLFAQKFRYLVVLDFEATCDEPHNVYPQEVIEWPAMIIDTQNRSILSNHFHFYVKPTVHPRLTTFCTNLTGITQPMVDHGKNIISVIRSWNQFCYQNHLLPNDNNEPEACIVTCGDWDLKRCWPMQCDIIKQNELTDDLFNEVLSSWCRCHSQTLASSIVKTIELYHSEQSLLNPALFHSWINIKRIFTQTYKKKRGGGMMSILRTLGIKHVGRHHSGIDDVRNICNIVLHILNDGVWFDYTFRNWNGYSVWDDIEMKHNMCYMQLSQYIESKPSTQKTKKKKDQKKIITIRLEDHPKNEQNKRTVVSGLSMFGLKHKKVLQKLKKQFGRTGGSIRQKRYCGKEIVIDGDKRNDTKLFLQQRFKIEPQFIELQ
eukprot:500978_1